MISLEKSSARRARRNDRERDLELLVLDELIDLVMSPEPVSYSILDDRSRKIVAFFVELNSEQRRALCERKGDVRKLMLPQLAGGRP